MEQLTEEEALEVADVELAHHLASEEAVEAGLGDRSGTEELVRVQQDTLTTFSSSIVTNSTAREASRSRPRHRGSRFPPSRGREDSRVGCPPRPR